MSGSGGTILIGIGKTMLATIYRWSLKRAGCWSKLCISHSWKSQDLLYHKTWFLSNQQHGWIWISNFRSLNGSINQHHIDTNIYRFTTYSKVLRNYQSKDLRLALYTKLVHPILHALISIYIKIIPRDRNAKMTLFLNLQALKMFKFISMEFLDKPDIQHLEKVNVITQCQAARTEILPSDTTEIS